MDEQNLQEQIKSLAGIEEGTKLDMAFDVLADQVPFIGNLFTTLKINDLSNRLKIHQSKINEISKKVNNIDDVGFTEFLKGFLFPIVLKELLEEDKDNKVGYFLDGFEQVVDHSVNDKAKILRFYDLLKQLRFFEIEYLISLSTRREVLEMNNQTVYDQIHKERFSYFETRNFKEMKLSTENKLESLGLIDTGRLASYTDITEKLNREVSGPRYAPSPNFKDEVEISEYGYKFLDFFYLLDDFDDEE